jgi:asparagine synthase (glutamine-hydrolysing)
MFALAAWYRDERRLFLARDAMGMKPLYYTHSTAPASLSRPRSKRSDAQGLQVGDQRSFLQQFLEFGYVFDPNDTMLTGVSKVPPGHSLTLSLGRSVNPDAYFTAPRSRLPTERPVGDVVDHLQRTLAEVVREHLVADVP